MAPRLVPASPWTRAAAAACVAAAVLVGYQLWRSDPPIDAAAPPPEQTTEQTTEQTGETEKRGESSAGFELPPAEDFAEVVERPLFSRSRRPAPPADEQPGGGATAGEETAGRIALNGVLLMDNRRVALLRFDNDPKVMHVAEGQEAGGWLIKKITADRVVVRRGQQESEILLDFRKNTNQQGAVPVPLSSTEPEAEVYDEGDQSD
jgi:hypothetical protein